MVPTDMLRIIQSTSAQGAKKYYGDGLTKGDYYGEGRSIEGRWGGRAAALLGLEGAVETRDFEALCDNLRPGSDRVPLTARTDAGRTVGYDFVFNVPKSVSVLWAATGDQRVVDAVREAADDTMRDVEREMKTRVRVGGRQEDRVSGNMAWASFTHHVTRPVDGEPDPHLHVHAYAFNATFDPVEGHFKAGQFRDVKRDAPWFEAGFHTRLASRVRELGYGVERTEKSWEIAGVPESSLERFSRRTGQIEALAEKLGITSAAEKDRLGAKTRKEKRKGLGLESLRDVWRRRMDPAERAAIETAWHSPGSPPVGAEEAVSLAKLHAFERRSVAAERELGTFALKRGVGSVTPEQVERELGRSRHGFLGAQIDGRRYATTREVLREEKAMVDHARRGRGACRPLNPAPRTWKDPRLTPEQRKAVSHILGSHDLVIALRGGAGTGKTTLTKEAVAGIEEGGRKVFLFAPSAAASRGVLRDEGFAGADTVASLLVDEKRHKALEGQVLWIDEAGLLGAPTLKRTFDLAEKLRCRVVLAGDVRQHGSVERGDALRVLEDHAGIKPAEVNRVQRQRGAYREAVEAIGRGDAAGGFDRLDALGAVIEMPGDRDGLHGRLAKDYADTLQVGKSALAVSPTHAEGEAITARIREELKTRGLLGPKEREVVRFRDLGWTEAQRRDPAMYRPGLAVQFVQNAKGFVRGQRLTVDRVEHGAVRVRGAGGALRTLRMDDARSFQVHETRKLAVASGDTLRITQNGQVWDAKRGTRRLDNGALVRVQGFAPNGSLRLEGGGEMPADFGHVAHGYVVTSQSSQGRTVDRVFLGVREESLPAASREQFYVSVSRGRESARIYTDGKDALRAAVTEGRGRKSAIELEAERNREQAGRLRAALSRRVERITRFAEQARTQMQRAADIMRGAWGMGAGRETGETQGRTGRGR